MSADAPERWGELVLEVAAEHEESVLGLLGEGILGAESRPAERGRVELRLFLEDPPAARRRLSLVASALRAAGIDPAGAGLHAGGVPDGRWVERYQAGLRPMPLGERFRIVPGSCAGPEPGRRDIRLVPGRAFGTGEHPTTRLCGRELEREVRPGAGWLDLGCGSGILSVVAHHCGAVPVLALDVDPEAVEVCVEVFEANGLGPGVRCSVGTIEQAGEGAWNGVVANISADYLVSDAGRIAGALAAGGRLIVAGFLEAEADEVAGAFRAAGLERRRDETEAGWSVAVLRRPE